MGTTANYSWPYPESSDYVADGATAIENLADAIDTTVENYNNPPRVLVYDFGGHSLTGAAYNTIAFDQERYDTHSMHDNAINNSRLTVPVGWGGKWLVYCGGVATTSGNNAALFVNGGGIPRIYGGYSTDRVGCSAVLILNAGDYVEMYVYSGSSGNLYGAGTLGGVTPYFGAIWMAP